MTFSVRNFLRQISMKTLKAYFESKNAAVPPEWWKYKEPKRVSELAGYLISGTDQPSSTRPICLIGADGGHCRIKEGVSTPLGSHWVNADQISQNGLRMRAQ